MMKVRVNCIELKLTFKILCLDISIHVGWPLLEQEDGVSAGGISGCACYSYDDAPL